MLRCCYKRLMQVVLPSSNALFCTGSREGHYRSTMVTGIFTADRKVNKADRAGAILY